MIPYPVRSVRGVGDGVPASAGGRGERSPYRPGLGAILGAIHLRTVVDTIGQVCTLDPF